MDRFVIRAPTWKTLNYTSMAAQSKRSSQTMDNKKKPLQQKQLDAVPTYDFDKRVEDLLRPNQATNAENFNANSNDSGLSSASSISPQQLDENEPRYNASPLKNLKTPTKNCLGKPDDYVDCSPEKENTTCMTITRTPKSQKKVGESIRKFEKIIEFAKNLPPKTYATPDKSVPHSSNMIMARIQRDLNSPSAAARVKALKAMKSPTKSAYSHFDIPETEQSLHIPEPPSLQDIMRNIVVYVEVRSGEDNRSAGVRKVIEALGARVNLSLLRDTTHVVFKDGLLSTFKKATQLGIPVVSILWIEACKNQRRICDPKDFQISNLDRYENPELYTKMKRIKSMQPDSECNKRVRAKAAGGGGSGGTPKDLTPTQKTAGAIKKTSTLIGGTPTSSTNKKKTDISQFFKKLERPTPNAATADNDCSTTVPESPATQLLNRINSECYTPLEQLKKTTAKKYNNNIEIYDDESLEGHTHVNGVGGNSPKPRNSVKKALDFLQNSVDVQTPVKTFSANQEKSVNTRRRRSSVAAAAQPQQTHIEIDASLRVNMHIAVSTTSPVKIVKPQRRHSLMPAGELDKTTNSMNIMAISNTPSRNTRRRSSIHTPRDMSMALETPNKTNNIQPILEEDNNNLETEQQQHVQKPVAPEKPPRSINKRRTLYAAKTMDQTDFIKTNENKSLDVEKSATKSTTRRRTIFGSKTMETSEVIVDKNVNKTSTTKVTNRRRTCFSLKSIEHTEIHQEVSLGKESEAGKTIAKNMNQLQVEKTPPTSPNKNLKQTNRRRTLYTPQKVNNTNTSNISTITSLSSNVSSNGACVTPSNFQTGKMIASSTLLEDSANKTKLVATPPADAVNGKLLEETAACVTPLIFSSSRQPGNKRRTLFDVSMDIITQRLQCINQSARRSLAPAPPAPTTEAVTTDVMPINTPNDFKKSKQIENNNSTPKSSSDNLTECNNEANNNNANVTTPEVTTLKKKRKLFMPNEMLLTPPPNTSNEAKTNSINSNTKITELDKFTTPISTTSTNSVTKRRRTLMPISQPQPTTTTVTFKDSIATTTPTVRKRRSTLDFEQIQNIKTKTTSINNTNNNNLEKNKKANDVAVAASSNITQVPNSDEDNNNKTKKMPVLVYTNMHHQQIDVIREAIDKLGIFTLESCVTDCTTHLVSLEPRRTLNLLRALARGLWILDFSWILESLKVNKWMPEEPYELRDFSRSIEICRSERQAFGEHYKCELFRKFGSFYVSSHCFPITKENLCELIKLCGGRVVSVRQKARYIIGDANRTLEDKFYLTPYWVLDSITQMQVMKISKTYMYPLPGEKPSTQLMPLEKINKI